MKRKTIKLLKAFQSDERGVTSIEYAVIIAAVSGGLLIALPATGASLSSSMDTVQAALGAPLEPTPKNCPKGGGGGRGGR